MITNASKAIERLHEIEIEMHWAVTVLQVKRLEAEKALIESALDDYKDFLEIYND